jgi:hypothetical protein
VKKLDYFQRIRSAQLHTEIKKGFKKREENVLVKWKRHGDKTSKITGSNSKRRLIYGEHTMKKVHKNIKLP